MSYMAVESISRHNFGHTMVDAMARPLSGWMPEPYAPRHVGGPGYYPPPPPPPEQMGAPSFRLPPMSSIAPASRSGRHDSPTAAGPPPLHTNVKPTYGYHDYQTPSPIQQTSPPLPPPTSQPHHHLASMAQQGRRHVQDLARVSPTLSSTASDRSAEDFQDASRPQLARIHQQTAHPAHLHHVAHPPPPLPPPPPPHPPVHASLPPIRHHNKRPSTEDHYSEIHPSKHHLPPSYPSMPAVRTKYVPHPPSPRARSMLSPRSEPKTGVKIADLLSSEEPRSAPSNMLAPSIRTPIGDAQTHTTEYRIKVRQQPAAARSCGFGERDRRVIDPPPIIQLAIEDPSLSAEEVSRKIRHPYSVVHCSIWDETGEQDNSAMPEDYRQQRRLMGTLVASPFVGLDENGEEGCFFCFPDLSCRTPGSFRLKFSLMIIDPMASLMEPKRKKFPIMAKAMSDVFTVYNAKDFPGMQASTPLTKKLKEQGCLISIKKGNEKSNSASKDESDDDDENSSGAKRKRRARRS